MARSTLKTVLIAGLWLGSLLATHRLAFDAGYDEKFNQRLTAEYMQVYRVGDLLKTHTPQQLAASIQAVAPPASWDVGGGLGSISYFETNQSFVVHHSGTTHDDIEELLDWLRRQ